MLTGRGDSEPCAGPGPGACEGFISNQGKPAQAGASGLPQGAGGQSNEPGGPSTGPACGRVSCPRAGARTARRAACLLGLGVSRSPCCVETSPGRSRCACPSVPDSIHPGGRVTLTRNPCFQGPGAGGRFVASRGWSLGNPLLGLAPTPSGVSDRDHGEMDDKQAESFDLGETLTTLEARKLCRGGVCVS